MTGARANAAARCALRATLLVLFFAVAACSQSYEDRTLRGQVTGGVAGAAIGSLVGSGTGQAVAIGAGAVLGTIAGAKIAGSPPPDAYARPYYNY